MASDLPPAYNSLHTSTANIVVHDETGSICDDGSDLVSDSFEDKTTRIGFIQKVLTIKLLQLILIGIVFGIFAATKWDVYRSMHYHGSAVHLLLLSTIAFVAITGLLIYCKRARRENPHIHVFLIVHPLSVAFFVSFWTIYLDFSDSVALAFLTYLVAVLSVVLYSVFALQTKLPFAFKYAVFLAGVVQILVYAFSVPFLWIDPFAVLYITLALSLDYIYIFWDLEYMMSMKYWDSITPDKFVEGALNLQFDYYYVLMNIIVPAIRKNCTEITVGH